MVSLPRKCAQPADFSAPDAAESATRARRHAGAAGGGAANQGRVAVDRFCPARRSSSLPCGRRRRRGRQARDNPANRPRAGQSAVSDIKHRAAYVRTPHVFVHSRLQAIQRSSVHRFRPCRCPRARSRRSSATVTGTRPLRWVENQANGVGPKAHGPDGPLRGGVGAISLRRCRRKCSP